MKNILRNKEDVVFSILLVIVISLLFISATFKHNYSPEADMWSDGLPLTGPYDY